jgi:hypothetical protein
MCRGKNEVCTDAAGEVRCARRDRAGNWDGADLRWRSGEDADWNGAGLEDGERAKMLFTNSSSKLELTRQ